MEDMCPKKLAKPRGALFLFLQHWNPALGRANVDGRLTNTSFSYGSKKTLWIAKGSFVFVTHVIWQSLFNSHIAASICQ